MSLTLHAISSLSATISRQTSVYFSATSNCCHADCTQAGHTSRSAHSADQTEYFTVYMYILVQSLMHDIVQLRMPMHLNVMHDVQ